MRILSVLMFAAACGPAGKSGEPHGDALDLAADGDRDDGRDAPGPGTWTVLVYMVADNDLEPFSFYDLEEMMQVGSGPHLNLIVQADWVWGRDWRPEGWDDRDYDGTRRMRVLPGSLEVIEELGEVDSADSEVLAAFVAWGLTGFPAQHTALILWDHGEGALGFGMDWSSGGYNMTPPAVRSGILEGLAAAGFPDGRVDLLGFDACTMAAWEVADAVRPCARFFLASEESIAYDGWAYSALGLLHGDDPVSPAQLGAALADAYAAQCEISGLDEWTLSLVDLDAMAAVEDALDGLTGALTLALAALEGEEIAAARGQATQFLRGPFTFASPHLVDLGDFAAKLAAVDRAAQPAAALATALAQAVVVNRAGSVYPGASGLSVYFPPHETFLDPAYEAAGPPALWREFLDHYLSAAPLSWAGPLFDVQDHETGAVEQDGTVFLSPTLVAGTAGQVDRASAWFGFYDPWWDVYDLYVQSAAAVDAQAGLVQAAFDQLLPVLSQDGDATYAFCSVTGQDGVETLDFPLDYWAPDEDTWSTIILRIELSSADGELLGSAYHLPGDGGLPGGDAGGDAGDGGAVGPEFDPAPHSVVSPVVYEWYFWEPAFEWYSMVVEFDPTLPIDFAWEPVEETDGQPLYFAVSAWDQYGAGDVAGAVGK